jgi:GNAT superfamily N-acetyltransferase
MRMRLRTFTSLRGTRRIAIIPDEEIDARTVEKRRAMWSANLQHQTDRITLVAWTETGTVVGFAGALLLNPPDRGFESYLQTLYLVEEAKGNGIGRRLLRDLATKLRDAGVCKMALRVLRLKPARQFYERLGARLVSAGIGIDEGVFKDDVVYAFDDLELLA